AYRSRDLVARQQHLFDRILDHHQSNLLRPVQQRFERVEERAASNYRQWHPHPVDRQRPAEDRKRSRSHAGPVLPSHFIAMSQTFSNHALMKRLSIIFGLLLLATVTGSAAPAPASDEVVPTVKLEPASPEFKSRLGLTYLMGFDITV